MADFKADSDVLINHIVDKRMELRLQEVFKKIEESAQKNYEELMDKFKPFENLQSKVDMLEEELAEMQEAQEIT